MTSHATLSEGAMRQMLRELSPTAVVCILVLSALVFIALTAPWLAPFRESEIVSNVSFSPPNETYFLGSDHLGRDILSRMFYGLRVTLSVTFTIVGLSFLFGGSIGFLSAIIGGITDTIIARIFDALISIPSIMLALILITALGPSMPVLIVAVAFVNGVQVFRVSRAIAMDIVVLDYIEAAKLRREGKIWIMRSEILPNVLPPLAAEFGVRIAYATIHVSALSFLGLGVQPPQADLGVMIRENMMGFAYETYAPLYPALGITAITVSVNLLVDWFLKRSGVRLPDEL